MYLAVNIAVVLAFIASAAVGYYTYNRFATLNGVQAAGLVSLFVLLTAIWVSGRIWMLFNQRLNPKRQG